MRQCVSPHGRSSHAMRKPTKPTSQSDAKKTDGPTHGEPLYACNDCGFLAMSNPTADRYPKQDDCLQCCSPSLFDLRTPSMLARKPGDDGDSDGDGNADDDD